jgi:predicted O-methyltransferase YrrM
MKIFTQDWFSHNIPFFEKFLSNLKDLRILEIGSFEGKSALWMIQNLKPKKIVLVDPGKESNIILKLNLSGLEYTLIEKPNNEAWKDYIFDEFDFVYIDGSHSSKNCYFDMILGWTVLKPGGIMAIDDYAWPLKDSDGTSPKEAVDIFLERKDYTLLHKGYQVWLSKI